jgi:hypothetical protein
MKAVLDKRDLSSAHELTHLIPIDDDHVLINPPTVLNRLMGTYAYQAKTNKQIMKLLQDFDGSLSGTITLSPNSKDYLELNGLGNTEVVAGITTNKSSRKQLLFRLCREIDSVALDLFRFLENGGIDPVPVLSRVFHRENAPKARFINKNGNGVWCCGQCSFSLATVIQRHQGQRWLQLHEVLDQCSDGSYAATKRDKMRSQVARDYMKTAHVVAAHTKNNQVLEEWKQSAIADDVRRTPEFTADYIHWNPVEIKCPNCGQRPLP